MTDADELAKLRSENERLRRLVFQSQPGKRRGISFLIRREKVGHGGATEYEVWLEPMSTQSLEL